MNLHREAITYEGTWNSGTAESYSYGGAHKYATDTLASATFNFVLLYYMSPLWGKYKPPVSTLVSLDLGPRVWVNLDNPGTSCVEISAVRWGASGLENGPHTVTISIGVNTAGQEGTWGDLDAFT